MTLEDIKTQEIIRLSGPGETKTREVELSSYGELDDLLLQVLISFFPDSLR